MKITTIVAAIMALTTTGCGLLFRAAQRGQSTPFFVRVASDPTSREVEMVRVLFVDPQTSQVTFHRDVSLLPGDVAVLEDVPAGEYEAVGVFADGYQDGGIPVTVADDPDAEDEDDEDAEADLEEASPVWFVHP